MNPRLRRSIQGDFSRIAEEYARLETERTNRDAQKLIDWIQPRPSERILDAACGPGTLARALAQHAGQVMGLDICPGMVQVAQRLARQAPNAGLLGFVLGDVESLPYPTSHFHLVTCTYAFANFPDPLGALREFARVLRPAGRILIADILAPEDPARAACLNRFETLRGSCYTRILKRSEFLELFKGASLRLESERIKLARRTFRDWLRLSPAATSRARAKRLREMLLSFIPDDRAGLRPGQVGREIFFMHTTGFFLLRKN
jgi:ubiquinone/menaquinone biosynthesis C-methylase UbiE